MVDVLGHGSDVLCVVALTARLGCSSAARVAGVHDPTALGIRALAQN